MVIRKSGKVSVLGYALLGLLARESLTGYGLTALMRERIGFFWGAGHSQVYPELARLEENGLVEHRLVEQSGRPDKKVYTVTDAGFEALREWVTAPAAPRPARDELTLKAYSLWVAGPGGAELFREEEKQHRERLAEYKGLRAWMEEEWKDKLQRPDSQEFASYAALRRGLGYEKEYAEWCRWVAKALENGNG